MKNPLTKQFNVWQRFVELNNGIYRYIDSSGNTLLVVLVNPLMLVIPFISTFFVLYLYPVICLYLYVNRDIPYSAPTYILLR